ncbi:MAG TPA: RecT family recombinase [Gaiellaceae bacterium]|nr:RecT family recombinase [Gaiellaceae bacterium]
MPDHGQQLERRQAPLQLAGYINPEGIDQISRALPEGVALARFDQAFATAMLKDPALKDADRTSLFLALVESARRGLAPDGRQAAIVVFGGKATFLPMIGGVRDTLAEYGWMLKASVVYANERFEIDEAAARVTHKRALADRGDVIGAYAIASHRDGRQRMATWMSLADIHEVRDKMGVAKNPAWVKWPNAMAEKTVAHRLADDVPLAPQDKRRVEWVLNATELPHGQAAELLYGPDGTTFAELPSGVTEEGGGPNPAAQGGSDVTQPAEPAPPGAPAADPDAAAATFLIDDEARMLADDAAEYVPTFGVYKDGGDKGPLTLRQIHDLSDGEGTKYLRMLQRRLTVETAGQAGLDAVAAYCTVYLPADQAETV